jgi:pimeloyl-ACP methyl ester carboxylesterase
MNINLPNGLHIHVRSRGEGAPTVLLVHGWAVSGRIWDELMERWPATAGRLLVPDLRGSGWSSKPRDGYSLDRHRDDILELIDQLNLSDLVLVGHSMGGTIAMKVALERRTALSKLILVSPVPACGVPFSDADVAYFRTLGGTRQGAEQVLTTMMTRKPSQELLDRVIDHTASVALEAFLEGFDAWRTASFADQIAAISTPTIVFGGEGEQPLSPDLLKQEVVARIRGASFRAIAGVGHYPQVEAPDEFVALLMNVLHS